MSARRSPGWSSGPRSTTARPDFASCASVGLGERPARRPPASSCGEAALPLTGAARQARRGGQANGGAGSMLEWFAVDGSDFDGPVLVTGAGGCIGSWALALLVRAGVPAVAFDLSDDRRRLRLLM